VSKVAIVSFISHNESVNNGLFLLRKYLGEDANAMEMLLYCDAEAVNVTQENTEIILTPDATKYKRILMALADTKSDYILFVDNDITPDIENIKHFLGESIVRQTDISWGTVGVSCKKKLVSKLILIDKILSHKIIRPALWKLNIGISVPGQVFLIDKAKFQYTLPQYDTVFDDLTIGICVKQNKLSYFYSPLCLGYERPSFSLAILAKQRTRWAKGFYQTILLNTNNKSMLPYIFIHGIAYHIMLFVFWFILYQIYSKIDLVYALALWFVSCFIISDKKPEYMPYAVFYTFVFPLIHLIWVVSLLYYSTINRLTKKVG
jgi:cellulose synthase/poly-beta-1,6-N-acetylglucosamine synthase-like glycosyltransferase